MNIQIVNLLKEKKLSDYIMEGLKKLSSKQKRKVSDPSRIYPSSFNCGARKAVLQTLVNSRGTQSKKAGSLNFMGSVGQSVHDILQNSLDEVGVAIFHEFHTPVIEHANIGGYLDSIILLDKLYLLEIKSCHSLPPKIKKPHMRQVEIYSAITGFDILVHYQINNGQSRMYLEEDELECVTFNIGYDKENAFKVMKQIFLSYILQDKEIVPTIPAEFTNNQCKNVYRCRLYSVCRSDDFLIPQEVPEHLEKLAEERATNFVDNMENRRNGILKHMIRTNKKAKKMLFDKDWEKIL
jgi:hypothetical protein